MKYRALRDGFADGHYVREGEEFEFSGPAPKWAEAMEQKIPPAKKGGKKDPFDGLTKGN